MIKSRYLRHKAVFQQPVVTKDAAGETNETFTTVATRFVDVRPLSVQSEEEQNANYEVSRLELVIRYTKAMQDLIKTGFRVVIDGKNYRVDELGDIFTRKKLTYIISSYE